MWEESATGGGVGFGPAAGINNGATYDPPVLVSTTFYRRRVSSGVCADDFSNEIQITVNALPTANVSGGGSVCAGNPAPDVVFTFTGTGPWDLVYAINGTNQPIVNNTTSPFTISNPGVGTYTIFSIADNNTPTCTVTAPHANITGSATVVVSATPPPTVDSFTATAAVCDDGLGTNPPDAILDLAPDVVANYDFTYNINGNVHVETNVPSDGLGRITISPPYSDWGSVPGSYVVTITALKNTATGCAGAVPFSSPALVVNPRPAAPANPVDGVACSVDPTGATLRVDDPGAGNLIQWFTNAAGTIAAVGVTGGVRQEQFTPTSNATQTYYAFAESQTAPTLCKSTSGTAVQHTQDLNPTAAADFPDFSTCNTSETLTATPADNGGSGLWTIGAAVYYESFPSSDNGMGITGPNPHATSFTHPANNWSITLPNPNVFTAATDWLMVDNGRISARDVNSTEVVWESKVINLTGPVDIAADIAETGVQTGADYIRVYYKINGGGETQFGAIDGDGTDGVFQTVSATGIGAAGNTLQIVMRARNNGATDEHWLDNIRVSSAGSALPVIADPSNPNSTVSNLQVGANTFTWTISSALGACSPTNDQVTITRHALPLAVDPLPQLCEDTYGSTDATVTPAYLTTLDNTVNGGNPAHTVKYYIAPTRLPADEIVANIMVSSTDQVYTRVTRTDVTPQCTQDGVVTFTVNPLPDALAQDAVTGGPAGTGNPETVYCEEFPVGIGIADNVDLTLMEDDIVNGGAPRAVAWFEADMVTPVATPGDIDGVVDGRTFFARVTNTLTNCVNFAQVDITVNPRPLDNAIETPNGSTPASYTVCAGTSILLFQVDPNLNPGSTYNWVIPTGPGQFVKFGGGNPTDFFVLLQFPNPVAGPGLPITVQETSAEGCAGNINTMNIIVDNAPAAPVIVGDNNVCANQQNVNYTISSPVGGSTYTWNVPGTLGSIVSGQGTSSIIVNMSSTSGNITVTETNANSCVSPPAAPFNVTVNARPVMTSSASAGLCSGQTVSGTLTLTANLVGTVFDWVVVGKVGPVGGASVGNSSTGQINQTLTNTSAGVGQVIYDVTPKIDIDPGPGFEYCNGPTQNVVIDVYPEPVGQDHAINLCSDAPLVYDIQTDNINTFGNSLPSEFTYTVVSSDPGNVPAEADRVAFSNAAINHTYTNTTTSNVAVTYTITPRFNAPQACVGADFTLTVTVRPEPVGAIDTKTICSGDNVAYDLAANISGMGNGLTVGTTYSWVAAPNGNVGGESTVAQPGANITDVLTNFTLVNEDVVYTVTPTSSLGCPGNPFTVTITVQPAPVGSNGTATVCSDLPLGINLTTSGTAVPAATYNIATNANGLTQSAGTVSAGAGKLANELADDAWTNTGLNPVNVVYTVTPVSGAGCLGANFTVTVTVDPEPVGANSGVTRCSDVAVGVTLTTNAGSVAAATYNVATNANGLSQSGGTVSAGNGKAANELADDIWENTGLVPVDVIYTVTPVSAAGCPGNPFTVTATIRPEPVGANSTSSFCSDQVLGVNITTNGGSVAATTFNIVVNPNGLIQSAGTSSAGNGKAANEIADDAWRNIGLVPVNVVYTITPISAAGCLGNDFTITATINPEPVGSNSSTLVCSEVPVGVTLSTSGTAVAAATYNIAVNPNGLVQSAGTPSAGVGKLANEIADDEWTNTGLLPVNVVYTITPVSAAPESCQGDPFTVTATINPAPVGSNSAATRCSDVAVGVNLTTSGASVAASSYNIAVAPNGLTLSAGTPSAGNGKGSNEIADDVWRNTGLNPVDVVYTIVPVSAAGCQGAAFTVTITVNPEPVGIVDAITRCSDDVVGINIATTPGSVAADNFTIAVNANGLTLSGGTASAGAGKAATEIADDIWRNTGLLPVDVVYTITPMSLAGCAGDPFTITVTVDPEPVGSNSNITRCSDAAVAVNLTTSAFSVAATDFDIAVNPNGLSQVGGTPSAGAGKAANEIADDVWRNTGPASVNVVYTITPNSGVPCSGDPFTVTVTVDPEPVLSAALNGTVCSDNIVNLTLATNGASVAASGYNIVGRTVHPSLVPVAQVVVPNNGVPATYLKNEIYRNVTNTPRTVSYDVVPVGNINGCLGDMVTVTITIDPEPVVATTLDATVCSDGVVNLVLATNGTSIGAADYNIVSRTVAGGLTPVAQVVVPNGNVAANYLQNEVYRNTTGGSLTVQYVVEATGTINSCLGNQQTITITVAPEPVISPSLDASVCSDNIVNLVLNTNGTSVAAANYNIVSRTVDPGLTPVAQVATPAMGVAAGYLQNEVYRNTTNGSLAVVYVVEATGTINGCLGDQRTITITIDPEPVISPTLSASVCSDNPVNLILNTVGTSVPAANYNIVSRTVAPGLTPVSQVLAPTNNVAANYLQNEVYRNTTNGALTVQYVVEARGTINNCLGDQVTIIMTIDPEPVVATTLDASVCSDATVGLVLNTNGTSVGAANYNIVSRTVAGALTPVTQVAVPQAGVAANYLQSEVYRNTTNNSLTVQYVVEATGTINGCLGNQQTITMTIDPEPVISPALDASVCSDNVVGLVLNTNGTSVSASNYNIVSRTVAPGLTPVTQAVVPANAVIATYLQSEVYRNTTNGSLTVVYVVEARGNINACLGNQETITITIDPEPVVSPALDLTVCSDDPTGLVLNTNGTSIAASSYNIVSRIVPGALSPVAQVAVPASGVAANYLQGEIYRNTTNGSLIVQYVVEARGTINNCLGDQRTINVTVDPEPVVSASLNATVCSNDIVNLLLNTNGTSIGAASYEIISRTVAGGLNPIAQVPVPMAGVGAAYLQNEVYENTTGASLTVVYVVRAAGTINGCVGDNRTITMTIDPEPVISPALDASVCSDNIVNLVLNTNGISISALNYNVVSRAVAPGLVPVTQVAVPASGVLPTYLQNEVYRNTTGGSLTVDYVVEAVGAINGCLGNQRTITITVDPEPVVATTLDGTVCSDDVVGLVLNTNGTSIAAANYNIVNRIVAGGLTPVTQVAVPATGVANNYLQNEVYRNTTNGSLTVQYIVNGVGTINGCPGDQQAIVITIAPEPVISTALDNTVCSDIATNLTLNTNGTSVAALNYGIVSRTVDPGLVPVNQVAVPAAGVTTTYLQGEIYQNTGSVPLDVVYVVEATGTINGCLSDQRTITITIAPEPVMDPGLDIAGVCSSLPIGLTLNTNGTSVAAANYNIQSITVPGGLTPGGGNLPVPANGVAANYLANHTFKNTGAVPLNVIYRVVPVSGAACLGDFIDITVTIDPEPVVDPALSTTVCSDDISGIVLNTNGASVAANSYDVALISQEAGLVGVPTVGAGLAANAIQNDVFTNTTAGPLKVTYEVTPYSGIGCVGQPVQIVLTVRPEPVLNPALDITRCSDADFNVALSTNGTSVPAASFNITNIAVDPGLNARPGNVNPLGTPYNGVGSTFLGGDSFENPTAGNLTVQYTVVPVSLQGCLGDPLVVVFTVQPEPVLDPALSPAPVCSDVNSGVTLGVAPGSVAAANYNINNIIRQPGLVAGGSNASIGPGQPANAIFNDVFTNTTAGILTVTYKIVPVSAAGCVGDEADVVFTIQPSPAMAATLDKTVCDNETTGIIFATSGSSAPAANYNIVNVTIQGGLTQTAGNVGARMGVAANEIQNDQFQNPGNAPLTVTYSVQGVTSATCTGPVKDIVLTVEPTITAVPVNNSTDICSATQTDIDLTSPTMPTSGVITFNYTAVSSIGGQMTGFVPALNNLPLGYKITDNLVNNSNSVATVTYTIIPVANGAKSGAGCIGAGVPVVVNVEPKPKLLASPLLQTVCESDGVNVSPTNILLTSPTAPSAGTLEFNQVSAVATGGMTLLSPLKTTYLNGESITDQWDNPTLSDQTVTYTLRPQVNGGFGCVGDDVVVTVTVKPRPIISPIPPLVVCSGEQAQVPFVIDLPFSFASWTAAIPPNISTAASGQGTFLNVFAINNGFNVETVTYTITPKANNCDGVPVTFDLIVQPKPDITGLPTTMTICNGDVLNVPLTSNVAGVTFDWVVDDFYGLGPAGSFDGSGTTINQTINNTTGSTATLTYNITPRGPTGCLGFTKQLQVTVGSIIPSVSPSQTEICSGGRIQMTNSSLGANSHRWFYRVQGTTTELDVRTIASPNYQLDNTSSTNPIVYEIVYQPSNGLCTVPDVVTPITVYRNVVAGFDEGTVPPIVGGTSTVNFTNTSNPVDAQFRYEWDFGSSTFASPATFVGANPPPVVYSQQGPYQVTLKAINIAAETAGLQCESTFFKNIVVPVLPLVADFTLDPPAACFPATVKVIENLSTGDVMEWKVVDPNGKVVAISNADLPEFFIPTPGLFNVQLTTRDSFTNQVEFANANFEIFDNPVASFQARPTTVFVPDTELTTFNFSTGADFYQWDFGDGETSDEREPKYTYRIEGVYDIVLVAGIDHGSGVVCTDTTSQKVVAKQGGQTKVPNAFTPNPAGPSGGVTGGGGGGTFNDVFLPFVKGVEEFNMQIFDRWGNLIFESNNANVGWDGYDKNGNILPAGVYIYKLTLRLSDGQRTTQIGDITMIR
ncbi:MAG: gliding motility-associated C-terminal domain-containing protein [Cyclobacteriaceae bacterium]|nr:gliding motility-associated C-terminal domain-containing protein [Cyclobacteriaceae bacterium]